MGPETDSIEYRSVIFSRDGVTEKAGMLAPLQFKKDEIKQIEVMKGFVAERPVAAMIAGIILLAGCIVVYADIFAHFLFGGTIYVETFLPIIFVPIAVWLMIYALKRNYFLLVHTLSGKRKIAFKGCVDIAELSQFIQRAQYEFGFDTLTKGEGGDLG
jgi:hypothetical protein